MIINGLGFVILFVFVPLWQNFTFRSGLIFVLDFWLYVKRLINHSPLITQPPDHYVVDGQVSQCINFATRYPGLKEQPSRMEKLNTHLSYLISHNS